MLISEQEKNRIIGLHENSKNVNGLLIVEQIDFFSNFFGPSDYDTRETGIPDAKDNKKIQQNFITFIETGKEIPKGTVVFPTKRHGDEFRNWANTRLPKLASKYQVDKKGKHTSPYLTNFLNVKLKSGKRVLALYTEENPTWMHLELKEKLEQPSVKVPNVVPGADRINRELEFINKRGYYDNKAFFIVDPRLNLVLAFDKDHKLIDYSQSVAGADKQKDELFTYEQWCVASGLKWNKWRDACAASTVQDVTADTPPYRGKMNYAVLADLQAQYASKGIYTINRKYHQPGYQGKKGIPNVLALKGPKGEKIGHAIHALVPETRRLKADATLAKALDKANRQGEIPKEYIDLIEKYYESGEFDLSAGCFNVSPEFVQNPKVLEMAKIGVPVFIMGEDETDYLVQVKPSDNEEFFNSLGGEDGMCMSTDQLISTYGNKVSVS